MAGAALPKGNCQPGPADGLRAASWPRSRCSLVLQRSPHRPTGPLSGPATGGPVPNGIHECPSNLLPGRQTAGRRCPLAFRRLQHRPDSAPLERDCITWGRADAQSGAATGTVRRKSSAPASSRPGPSQTGVPPAHPGAGQGPYARSLRGRGAAYSSRRPPPCQRGPRRWPPVSRAAGSTVAVAGAMMDMCHAWRAGEPCRFHKCAMLRGVSGIAVPPRFAVLAWGGALVARCLVAGAAVS
ncbi:hypothetical protein ABIE67_000076 [Streptomyces sp. V4I8]